jgi:RNA polymerase sigma factor (sigma-70 family)
MPDSTNKNIDFLWRSFLKGDDKSFSIIYQQHVEGLFSYGLKLSPDREAVKDCIQEVFIVLFQKRNKIDIEIKNLKSYLFVALRNCIIKKITQTRKYEPLKLNEDKKEIKFHVEYSFHDKLIELEISNEIKNKLHTAINNLPVRQKEIIYLKFEEEMNYDQIAKVLKISIESARKLMYRALLSLREVIDPGKITSIL